MKTTVNAAPSVASLALLFAAATLTACGASNPAPVSSSSAPAPAAAPSSTPSAVPTQAPTAVPTAAPAPATTAVVIARGTMLVAAANGMTVYSFNMDSAGSGRSNCNEGCTSTWPPLTVPAGATATGGAGVTGQVATITRGDGTIQVTYNGKPLYFFANDRAPGDTRGHYTGWSLVAP